MNKIFIGTLSLCSSLFVLHAQAAEEGFINGGSLKGKARLIHFDRDYEDDDNDRKQTALGLELNYQSGHFNDVIAIGISGYHAEELGSSGLRKSDILNLKNNGELDDSVSLIGQAFIDIKTEHLHAKIGRQKAKTMLFGSSGSRALPSTFRGVRLDSQIGDVTLYGLLIDQVSHRHDDSFEELRTDTSEEGDIDWVRALGVKYQQGPITLELEQLVVKDYMEKWGLRGSHSWTLNDNEKLTLSAGYFTSSDDGDLFVSGAESGDLDDEDATGAIKGVTPVDHDGRGYYTAVKWQKDAFSAELNYSHFSELWIEDNYNSYSGVNPIPTRAANGPDMAATGESVWKLSLGYDWSQWVPKLNTKVSYTEGRGAENTVDKSLGKASENILEIDTKWSVPGVKGLKLRWRIFNYHASENGSVDTVKGDEFNHRLYVDYSFKF